MAFGMLIYVKLFVFFESVLENFIKTPVMTGLAEVKGFIFFG